MLGWIILHRKIREWEWYTDVNTAHLFMHLLLCVNHQQTKWRGHTIEPGQLLTGRKQLAQDTGLSEQSVRSSLAKLKATNEINAKSYPKYSIITMNNWQMYRDSNQQNNQLRANESAVESQAGIDSSTSRSTTNQPATNQQPTTSNQYNNNNNIKNHDHGSINIKSFFDRDEKALSIAKKAVPGKDIYYYFNVYDEFMIGKAMPGNPIGSFINWYKSYTKKEAF